MFSLKGVGRPETLINNSNLKTNQTNSQKQSVSSSQTRYQSLNTQFGTIDQHLVLNILTGCGREVRGDVD